jgi:Flp pilus assembly protein TadD
MSSAEAAYRRGVAYLDHDQLEEALHAFRTAVHLDPYHSDAYANLGVLMEVLGNPHDALHCYEAALAADPAHARARTNLAMLKVALQMARALRAQAFNPAFV